MASRDFRHRAETFGFDTPSPWSFHALRLLLSTPRLYAPLVDAWELHHPGTKQALARMVKAGFVAHQAPVIIDTRTGDLARQEGQRLERYRLSAKGRRLYDALSDDLRVLEDTFSNLTELNTKDVARLLSAFYLEGSHAKLGMSAPAAISMTNLPARTGRWWVTRLQKTGHLTRLPNRLADTREVVPAHWRATRLLCRQLRDVLEAFHPAPDTVARAWRLNRTRFLSDVDPARIGISGATDFDHDVEAQRVLADLLRSPAARIDGQFVLEPRLALPVDTSSDPWSFRAGSEDTVFYQPDAELREVRDGRVWRTVVEYERYQSRRDAWSHIERMLGYLSTSALPFESAVLRFVLDGEPRMRSYVKLIEGFAAYALQSPEAMPANRVILMVSSSARLAAAADPLDDFAWFRIPIATPAEAGVPRLHPVKDSPYDEFVL
jgi:hypothetical protein